VWEGGEGGKGGVGGDGKKAEEGKKKRWVKVSKKTWGMIMKEPCNFDLFYDLWDRAQLVK
jgi:hypothetical protein